MGGALRLILLIAIIGFVVFAVNSLVPMPSLFVYAIDVIAAVVVLFLVVQFLLGTANAVDGGGPSRRWW